MNAINKNNVNVNTIINNIKNKVIKNVTAIDETSNNIADKGAVTAEFAIILPVVVLLMGVLLSCGYFIIERVRCHNIAHMGARVISASYFIGKTEENKIKDLIKGVNSQARVDIIPITSTSENSGIDGIKVKVTCPLLPDSLRIFPTLIHGEAVGIPQEKFIQPLFNSSRN